MEINGLYESSVSLAKALFYSLPVVGIPASLASRIIASGAFFERKSIMIAYVTLQNLRNEINNLEVRIEVAELEHRPVLQEERARLANLREQTNQVKNNWKGRLEEITLNRNGIVYSVTGVISGLLTMILSISAVAMGIIGPMSFSLGISFGIAAMIMNSITAYLDIKNLPKNEQNIRYQHDLEMRTIRAF
jgi:hypothetical protein